jgi:hypothetical protein
MNYYMNVISLHRYNSTGYTLEPRDICRATPDCDWTFLYDYSPLRSNYPIRTTTFCLIRLTEQLYKCRHAL